LGIIFLFFCKQIEFGVLFQSRYYTKKTETHHRKKQVSAGTLGSWRFSCGPLVDSGDSSSSDDDDHVVGEQVDSGSAVPGPVYPEWALDAIGTLQGQREHLDPSGDNETQHDSPERRRYSFYSSTDLQI
jgi:hypothetical protein